MKFVLLHDAKGDEGVKVFFTELWELYVKVSMRKYFSLLGPRQRGFVFFVGACVWLLCRL